MTACQLPGCVLPRGHGGEHRWKPREVVTHGTFDLNNPPPPPPPMVRELHLFIRRDPGGGETVMVSSGHLDQSIQVSYIAKEITIHDDRPAPPETP